MHLYVRSQAMWLFLPLPGLNGASCGSEDLRGYATSDFIGSYISPILLSKSIALNTTGVKSPVPSPTTASTTTLTLTTTTRTVLRTTTERFPQPVEVAEVSSVVPRIAPLC